MPAFTTSHATRVRRALLASGTALGTAAAGVLFAVPAQAASTVTLNRGVLAVVGDIGRNSLAVSSTPTGVITLNGTEVLGGTVTLADVSLIVMDGGPADDTLRIEERNAPLPPAHLVGNAGNDQLFGGSGNDELFGGDGIDSIQGGRGDDTILGGRGNDKVIGGSGADVALLGEDADQFTWNPGDGNDFVEGEAGKDTLLFNGSAANENVSLSPDRSRLRIARDVGGVVLSVAGFELVKTNLSSGQDRIQVTDLSAGGTNQVQVSHVPTSGVDDGFDTVVVAGTSGVDRIRLFGSSPAGTVTVGGLATTILASGTEGLDLLGLAGDDILDAARLPAGVIQLTESGGNDNDVLVGTPGNDTLLGGDGNDRLEGRGGLDVLDGGRGDNVIIR